MYPSTSSAIPEAEFAAEVLRNLLSYIELENRTAPIFHSDKFTCMVSHAWTAEYMLYLVYRAAPSDRTWGLVRDIRTSNMDGGPWLDLDEAVRYTYLLDLEEHWVWTSRSAGEPDTIRWFGDRHDGLPTAPSDIAEDHRYTPPTGDIVTSVRPGVPRTDIVHEPRRYADPDGPPPGTPAP